MDRNLNIDIPGNINRNINIDKNIKRSRNMAYTLTGT